MTPVLRTEKPIRPRWRVVSAVDRRVLGVLVEKAKTTPDAYPLSVNALRTGCNQKNNRDPQMQLEMDDVEESLSRCARWGPWPKCKAAVACRDFVTTCTSGWAWTRSSWR